MKNTKRYEHNLDRPINKDVITDEYPEIGFIAKYSEFDPEPSIRLENSIVVEMDGKERDEFDSIDMFIADYGINKDTCQKSMELSKEEIAKMLVDVNITREEVVAVATGLTPAKLAQVIDTMNIVEIMMAQMKMRARKSTANQAHVTNHKDNPVLMAADAAEAALRGFAELETTCVVGRYAPFNALALLVGSQVGRPGVITQCAMEEAFELQLGVQGLTSYAETISVYGTEKVFTDGDDTPWSKAFLASAYASRGIKMRSSSGSGSEVLMGETEGHSMLYLETRCVWLTKACGIQGTQNGSIDGLALSSSVQGGLKMVAGESMLASMLGLEVASGNDTWFTDSDMRRAAKFLVSLLPGTDYISSGYSATPNSDNVFAGSNEDSDDHNDYYMIQRDYLVDGGLHPVEEADLIATRRKAAKAMQAIFDELKFPPITDDEIEAAVYAYDSKDIPDRNPQNDIKSAETIMSQRITGIDVARALKNKGFDDVADSILELIRQRVAGDYLQTSAIFDDDFKVNSLINRGNSYSGPGTAYKMDEVREHRISKMESLSGIDDIVSESGDVDDNQRMMIKEKGIAKQGSIKDEVTIVVSPSFGLNQRQTLGKVPHLTVLDELSAGLEEEGVKARFIKSYETSDSGAMASIGSNLSGSGISISIQSKGTTVIHQKDLSPLFNLELFSQAPQLKAETFREIGKSAGKYAKGEVPDPLPAAIDPQTRRFLVKSAILHNDDTKQIESSKKSVEFEYTKEVK